MTMWPTPPSQGPAPAATPPSPMEPNWEELFDSGMLDQQLGSMGIHQGGRQPQYKPQQQPQHFNPHQHQQQRGYYNQQQQHQQGFPQRFAPHHQQQPMSLGGGYQRPNQPPQSLFSRPPPNMFGQQVNVLQRPPNTLYQPNQRQPQYGNYGNQRSNRPQQQRGILQRPQYRQPHYGGGQPSNSTPQLYNPKAPTSSSSSSSAAASSSSTQQPQPVQIQQPAQIQTDRGTLTQYRPPEPKMKILKRPQSSPSNLDAAGGGENASKKEKEKSKSKTLKQREEEYAQARLRILGSAANPDEKDAAADDASKSSPKSIAKSKGGEANPTPPSKSNNNKAENTKDANVLRTPKGPDGTKGFHDRK